MEELIQLTTDICSILKSIDQKLSAIESKVIGQEHETCAASRSEKFVPTGGYCSEWQKYCKLFLAEHPLCAECEKNGILMSATVVDHIIPCKEDHELYSDSSNHQPLCSYCHNIKTAKEDEEVWNI